jgi:uncharacterized protein (TIRG00374 family)
VKGKNILKISISVLLILFIVYNVGVEKIWNQFSHMKFHLLILAIVLDALGVIISAKKWQILLHSKLIHIPYARILKHYYIGVFFNAFLPTTIGGDAVKSYYLSKELDKRIEAFSSVIMERLTGLIAIVLIGTCAIIAGYSLIPHDALIIAILVIVPGPFLLMVLIFKFNAVEKIISRPFFSRFPRITEIIVDANKSLREYSSMKYALGISLAISFLYHILLIFINYVLALALGLDIGIFYFFVFVPVTEILILLPITIQGFGVRSGSYITLFSQVGISSPSAFALGFSMQMVKVIGNIIGGIVYATSYTKDYKVEKGL